MAASITFTKVANKVKIMDGSAVLGGLSIYTNVFEHPHEEAIILTNDTSIINSLNGSSNCMKIVVADVQTPSAVDKTDLATQLIENYFS